MRIMMNLDNFFNTVSPEDENPKKTMSDLIDSPLIWVGTFEKLVLNYLTFGNELINFFKSAIPDLDDEQIKESGKGIVCNRAFEYISKLDLNDPLHLESLQKRSSVKLLKTLRYVLMYFESTEEFEKCVKLKNISDYVEYYISNENN